MIGKNALDGGGEHWRCADWPKCAYFPRKINLNPPHRTAPRGGHGSVIHVTDPAGRQRPDAEISAGKL